MSHTSAGKGRIPVVAVVGGGASGTLTAVHLLRLAEAVGGPPPRVVLIDRDGRHGTGLPYVTDDPGHLLNTPVERMSALSGDPGHLPRWLGANGLPAGGGDFLPRGVYGRYLRGLLDDVRLQVGDRLETVTGTVSAVIRRGRPGPLRVCLAGGGAIDADAVVLAMGNGAPAARLRLGCGAGARHVADPWAPGALARICDGRAVLVVGTGLTMVDVAATVTRAHPGAVVYAVSRHGLLPQPHRCPLPPPVPFPLPDGAVRLADLMRAVRVAVRNGGGDWRGVVDGLRPHVPLLWARMGPDDRRRFLDLVARYWEVHRHRIPPETAARVAALREAGRLRVLRGGLADAAGGPDGLTVRVDTAGGTRELRVGWLVNATGPAFDPARDPFLANLLATGLARPDPLRLGLDADDGGAVLDAAGRPQEAIFTLGPTLRGVRYETTAIPEIREQAAALAPRLLAAISPGSRRELVSRRL